MTVKERTQKKWLQVRTALIALTVFLTACSDSGVPDGPSAILPVASMDAFREALDASHAGLVMVDLYADWCSPCKALEPVLEKIARTHTDRVTVYKVDVDKMRQVLRDYRVRGIPHVLFFREGRLVHRLVGLQPASAYERAVRRLS